MQVLSEFKIFLSVLYVVILRIVKHLMLLLICVMILYIMLLWYIDYLITCLSECWVCLLAWGSMGQMHGIPCSPLKGKSVQEWDREQTERGLGYNSGALWSCLVTVSLNVPMLSEHTSQNLVPGIMGSGSKYKNTDTQIPPFLFTYYCYSSPSGSLNHCAEQQTAAIRSVQFTNESFGVICEPKQTFVKVDTNLTRKQECEE